MQIRLSYDDARAKIQASDHELDGALKDRHILNINGLPIIVRPGIPPSHFIPGELRPIAPSYLSRLLELILNLLVSLSLPRDAAAVEDLCAVLADEHEIPRAVSWQVMSWFGTTREGKWNMDANAVLKEMGVNILRHQKV